MLLEKRLGRARIAKEGKNRMVLNIGLSSDESSIELLSGFRALIALIVEAIKDILFEPDSDPVDNKIKLKADPDSFFALIESKVKYNQSSSTVAYGPEQTLDKLKVKSINFEDDKAIVELQVKTKAGTKAVTLEV